MTNGMIFWPLVLAVALSMAAEQYRYSAAFGAVLALFVAFVAITTRR